MNNIDEQTRMLIEEIKSTREFCRLKHSKDTLVKNTELKNKIVSFKHIQEELFTLSKITDSDKEKRLTKLTSQFQSLSQIPEVAEYLEHYKRFNELMMRVNKTITIAIEDDLNIK